MNASQYIIGEILRSMESGSAEALSKFAKRYLTDRELQRIYESHAKEQDAVKTISRLKSLEADRKIIHSGGTQLNLKDRRDLVIKREKRE